MSDPEERIAVLEKYRVKLRELRELEARLKSNRAAVQDLVKEFNETEDNLKALQVPPLCELIYVSHECIRDSMKPLSFKSPHPSEHRANYWRSAETAG